MMTSIRSMDDINKKVLGLANTTRFGSLRNCTQVLPRHRPGASSNQWRLIITLPLIAGGCRSFYFGRVCLGQIQLQNQRLDLCDVYRGQLVPFQILMIQCVI
ncbi:hypothetical protein O9992_05275 [Vibrio lentus]|nr:hypothetical protein [Vibrio lentus]